MEKELICQKCGEKSLMEPRSDIMGISKFLGFPIGKCKKCNFKNVYPLHRSYRIGYWVLLLIGIVGTIFIDKNSSYIFILSFFALFKDFLLRRKIKAK